MVSRPAGGDTHHSPSRPGVIIVNSATAQTEAWFSLKELVSTQGIQSMRGGVKLSSHNCACLMVAQASVAGAQSFLTWNQCSSLGTESQTVVGIMNWPLDHQTSNHWQQPKMSLYQGRTENGMPWLCSHLSSCSHLI